MDASRYVVAVLLAYAVSSILLIFLNKAVLSKVRQLHEAQASHYSAIAEQQYFGIGDSDVHFRERNNILVFLDYDVFKLTFAQCAFTAVAMRLILRFLLDAKSAARPRPSFGLYEFVTANLFVAMLLTANLCVKLIPVSLLPVSRSFTFIFVLALEYLASKVRLCGEVSSPGSLFTARRCVVYALIVFGYVGAMEIQSEPHSESDESDLRQKIESIELRNLEPEVHGANDTSFLTSLACGLFNSLVTALTSLAIKFTMRKRSEQLRLRGVHCPHVTGQFRGPNSSSPQPEGSAIAETCDCGGVASAALCYSMNAYATALCAALFCGYQLVALACGTPVFVLPAAFRDCEWNRLPGSAQRGVSAAADWLLMLGSAVFTADWNLLYSAMAQLKALHIDWLLTSVTRVDWQFAGLYLTSSLVSVLVSMFNLAQIELCAPLTVQIANATKSVVLTLLAVVYYSERHTSVWYAANASTLFATLLYTTDASRKPKRDQNLPDVDKSRKNGLVSAVRLHTQVDKLSSETPGETLVTKRSSANDCVKQRSRSTSQHSQAESLKNGHLTVKKRH